MDLKKNSTFHCAVLFIASYYILLKYYLFDYIHFFVVFVASDHEWIHRAYYTTSRLRCISWDIINFFLKKYAVAVEHDKRVENNEKIKTIISSTAHKFVSLYMNSGIYEYILYTPAAGLGGGVL